MDSFELLGEAPAFRSAIQMADRFAASDLPVLILGETGVGKELFARRLHRLSQRARGPFTPVNCGALPPGLFESELFGHERGAFSGAITPHRGLVKASGGGTLFLDEIGDLDLGLQVKLLRLLDSGEVRMVGSTRVERTDFRVIAATNCDLSLGVKRGVFRLDLLERLSVLVLNIPSLRERRGDISLLARKFFELAAMTVSDSVIELLQSYNWPGNVRQLQNFVLRVSVLDRSPSLGFVTRLLAEEKVRHLSVSSPTPDDFSDGSLADIERRVILYRLERCRGSRTKTAEELGIAKSTLQEKLRRWRDSGTLSTLLGSRRDSP